MDDPTEIETTIEQSVNSRRQARQRLARIEHHASKPTVRMHSADLRVDPDPIESNTQRGPMVLVLGACVAAGFAFFCVMRIDTMHMSNTAYWAIESTPEAVALCAIVAAAGGFVGFSVVLCACDLFKWLAQIKREVKQYE